MLDFLGKNSKLHEIVIPHVSHAIFLSYTF